MEHMNYSEPNILIVDDIKANLVVLSEMICNLGYIARPVISVKHAIEAIETLAPYLILLDVSMPEMGGFEFCELLKKNVNTRDIPIIFISALSQSKDRIRGFQLGAVDYISKPFELEEVSLRINTHLRIYKLQREMELYNKKLFKIINDQTRKINQEQVRILQAMICLAIKRDKTRSEHIDRVGKNCSKLAMGMQLSPLYKGLITNCFVDSIEHASIVHDIGKVAIPDNILMKNGPLSPEEMEVFQTHTVLGANALKEVFSYNEHSEFYKMAIDIVLYHHEHWDGSGYPEGLRGTNIPLSARIVAVVDAYDEVLISQGKVSDGALRNAMNYINDGSGTKFDPDIVGIFNKIFNQLKK